MEPQTLVSICSELWLPLPIWGWAGSRYPVLLEKHRTLLGSQIKLWSLGKGGLDSWQLFFFGSAQNWDIAPWSPGALWGVPVMWDSTMLSVWILYRPPKGNRNEVGTGSGTMSTMVPNGRFLLLLLPNLPTSSQQRVLIGMSPVPGPM